VNGGLYNIFVCYLLKVQYLGMIYLHLCVCVVHVCVSIC